MSNCDDKQYLIEKYIELRKVLTYSNIVKNKSNQILKTRKEPELRKVIFQNNLIKTVDYKMRSLYIY
jgi:hypothetical protein